MNKSIFAVFEHFNFETKSAMLALLKFNVFFTLFAHNYTNNEAMVLKTLIKYVISKFMSEETS